MVTAPLSPPSLPVRGDEDTTAICCAFSALTTTTTNTTSPRYLFCCCNVMHTQNHLTKYNYRAVFHERSLSSSSALPSAPPSPSSMVP
jgi:hypothetical protein